MDHNVSECVIALYKSKLYKGTFRRVLGDHTVESARNAGYDFYLKEGNSGVFTVGRTNVVLPVNARCMRIFCPWHESGSHFLKAIDNKTLVCTQCNPRLEKLI